MNEDGTVDDTQDKGDKGSVSSHLSTDGNTDKKLQDRGKVNNGKDASTLEYHQGVSLATALYVSLVLCSCYLDSIFQE